MVDIFFPITKEETILPQSGPPKGWNEKLEASGNEMPRIFIRLRNRPKAPDSLQRWILAKLDNLLEAILAGSWLSDEVGRGPKE